MWKPIKETNGFYFVSDKGEVLSFKGATPRILKQRNHRVKRKCGDTFYKSVTLRIENENKHNLIHRLVAEAFIDNPNNYPIINHKDENPQNNSVENLEWCTHEYNLNYGNAQTRKAESRRKGRKENEGIYGLKI